MNLKNREKLKKIKEPKFLHGRKKDSSLCILMLQKRVKRYTVQRQDGYDCLS